MTDHTARPDRIDQQLLRRHRRLQDDKAHTELVRRHTPMVRSLARHHAAPGLGVELAVRSGVGALSEAIERYDPARGERFAAFAHALVLSRMAHTTASAPTSPRLRPAFAPIPAPAAPRVRRDQDPRYEPALPG